RLLPANTIHRTDLTEALYQCAI
ncbi:DNA mismatch repair endonuclease MutH, partial [Vibrio parahaemolyticus AQ3810]